MSSDSVRKSNVPISIIHAGVGKPMRISPWAEYAVVSVEQGRLGVELRRTSYDVEGYLQSALSTGMPHAEWWVECWATGFARGAPSGAPEWA